MFLSCTYFRYNVLAMKSMLKILCQYDLQGNMIRNWDHVTQNREFGTIIWNSVLFIYSVSKYLGKFQEQLPPQKHRKKFMSGNEWFLSLIWRLHSAINTFRLQSGETHKIPSVFNSNFKEGDISPMHFCCLLNYLPPPQDIWQVAKTCDQTFPCVHQLRWRTLEYLLWTVMW